MSLPLSDASLETIRRRVQQRGALRDQRYRGRVTQSIAGLAACQCHGKRLPGRGLHGYRIATLHQRTGLSGVGAAADVALIPVSDKSAVANAVKYFVAAQRTQGISGFGASDTHSPTRTEVRSPTRTSTHAVTTGNRTSTTTDGGHNTTTNNYACAPRRARLGLSGFPLVRSAGLRSAGLGATEQAQGAASGAAAGAKAGSIIPVVGTVIGAVVGAVVGWLSSKPKPVRATAEQVAQCRAMLSEYMQFASQTPNAPIPLDKDKLRQLNWCMDAIYGGHYVGVKDPRWFDPDVEGVFIPAARAVVKVIYATPVGQPVNIEAISFKDPKGRSIAFKGYTFVNPLFTDLKSFAAQVFQPMMVQMCKETAGKGAPGCDAYYGGQVPEFTRWLYDLLAWAAREELPNISEADLRAASQVAQSTGTAAKDVVSAVEQIINRPVVRGETSALLTGQTDQPGVTAPTPVVNVPPSTAPPLPGVTTQAAADVTALISQLVAQNAATNQATQAALNALANQGTPITPAVITSVQKEVAAQQVTQAGGLNTALLTGGGLLAAFFLLGRPAKRGQR